MEERNATNDILATIEQEMDSDIHPLLKKILDNIKPIGITIGGIVVAVAVYSGVTTYQESQREKAVSELGVIMTMADQTARIQKLEAFAASGPKELRSAAQLELAAFSWIKTITRKRPVPGGPLGRVLISASLPALAKPRP